MSRNIVVFAWIASSFAIGTLFGFGAVWRYFERQLNKQEITLATHRQMGEIYLQIMELFKRYNVKVIPGTVWQDTVTNKWADTEQNKWEAVPDTTTIEIDAKSRQEIFLIQKRLELLLDNLQAHENALAKLEKREARTMDLDFIPPEFRQGLQRQKGSP